MMASLDALAWVSSGEIVIHDEGHGSRVTSPRDAEILAEVYSKAASQPNIGDAPLTHFMRWVTELRAAIAAQSEGARVTSMVTA